MVELTPHHWRVREDWDDYYYCIDWTVQLPGNTEEAKRVHCCIRRLSDVCEVHWKEGCPLILKASAHTNKYKYNGTCLTSDKSVFCEHLNDIVSASLELLSGFSKKSAKKKAAPKKPALSPIQKFIKDYDGYVIEDCITVTGKDFKSYCSKLKNALNKEAKAVGFDGVTLKPNHYDMSGFFNKGNQYVYWSFNVSRGDQPTYLTKKGVDGFLYRTAKSDKDFTGGNNHFTDLANLVTEAYRLL